MRKNGACGYQRVGGGEGKFKTAHLLGLFSHNFVLCGLLRLQLANFPIGCRSLAIEAKLALAISEVCPPLRPRGLYLRAGLRVVDCLFESAQVLERCASIPVKGVQRVEGAFARSLADGIGELSNGILEALGLKGRHAALLRCQTVVFRGRSHSKMFERDVFSLGS